MNDIINLIFLDVDGVLNSHKNEREHIKAHKSISSYKIKLPDQQLQNLKEILLTVPNTKIIISSSWRKGGPNGQEMLNLTNHLARYDMYISGVTPIKGRRGDEIHSFLLSFSEKYGYIPPYIILDDVVMPVSDHKGHIVYCDPRYGLEKKGVNISINLLNKFREEILLSDKRCLLNE